MKLNHITSILIIALFLICSKLNAQTVYITDTGKKYHAKNCSLAKTGKKGVELAEAKKQGYEACKNCKAIAGEEKSKAKKEVKK